MAQSVFYHPCTIFIIIRGVWLDRFSLKKSDLMNVHVKLTAKNEAYIIKNMYPLYLHDLWDIMEICLIVMESMKLLIIFKH
ncbi:hypothetical protein J6TS2_25870 [Heyndrickxia sporothermodurans]|nr:hypothetical protein J6TS2_25870 [Heyndrickxia sporothermodurans]